MTRRTKLIILILVAALLLGLGLWLLLRPLISPSDQPPSLPPGVTPTSTTPEIREPIRPAQTPGVTSDIRQLENLAANAVTRIGSGSNTDGFRGYEDVLLNATPSYQTTLRADQAAMQQRYPADGVLYGITTRVVSVDSSAAISGADVVPFTLQAQQVEDAGNPVEFTAVFYKEVTVSFRKQADGGYLIDGIVWTDIEI